MYLYIAYRNLKDHYAQNNACGGPSYNNDYRFTAICDGVYYLLTKGNMNYAVSKENGDKFIEEVKSKCNGEHFGFFPLVPSLNGKETAAVVEMSQDRNHFYYDMDDELLLQMLDDLKAKSGNPLNERELMNYCYPNPALPEGDFELCEIYHGIYFKPDNTPVSVIRTFAPDKKVSILRVNKNGSSIQIRTGDNNVISKVPEDLISWIKETVRELCCEPAEAYVDPGNWEGYVRFGKKKDRIFTDPDKTLGLLNEIASKSEYEKTEVAVNTNMQAINNFTMGAFSGLNMMGGMAVNPSATSEQPAEPASGGAKCSYCGADVTGKKFCTECGEKVG